MNSLSQKNQAKDYDQNEIQKGEIVQQGAGYKSLIQSLRQQPSYLIEKYNQQKQIKQQKEQKQNQQIKPTRAGGVYVPPHKLRAMQQQLLQSDPNGKQHQQMMWQLLRKSINGIVNKVNISNIQNIVIQLFNQNILRGKGVLARALIKAQMASPNFTHVYAALIAVINTKLPEIGQLIINRVLLQFKRSFSRNNKIVCLATTKMIAHLINQRVLGEYIGLQLLLILLSNPTQDSVQIACDFMVQVGQVLSQTTPAGTNAIFERFKSLLHEGQIEQKAQYSIQNLFAVRKTGFKNHPGVIPQLDLVQLQDQLTHNFDFQENLNAQQNLNIFKFDPNYEKTEQQWDQIKLQILGQQNVMQLKQPRNYQQQMQMQEQQQEQQIQDLTQQDLINLRRTIYLAIQSTVNFQQCAHKILKMNIAKGYEGELVDMIIQCSMMQRIYQDFFGLLAQRFCTIDDLYKQLFIKAFVNHYNNIFKQEANKIRNLGKLFSHLFYTHAIDWKIFQIITLKPDTTTAAGRMFLKIIFRGIAQHMGIQKMDQQFSKQDMAEYYQGLFPIDHPNNVRFAINYFTSIGLGKLTERLRDILQMQQNIIAQRKQRQDQQKYQALLRQQQELLQLADQAQKRILQQAKIKQQQQRVKRQNARKQLFEKKDKNKEKSHSSSSQSSSSGSSQDSSSNQSQQMKDQNKDKGSKKVDKSTKVVVANKNVKNAVNRQQESSSGISSDSQQQKLKKQNKKKGLMRKRYQSEDQQYSPSSSSSQSQNSKKRLTNKNKRSDYQSDKYDKNKQKNKRRYSRQRSYSSSSNSYQRRDNNKNRSKNNRKQRSRSRSRSKDYDNRRKRR